MSTTILTCEHIVWINIVNPDSADMKQLSERYPQFHPLNLQDCLSELVIALRRILKPQIKILDTLIAGNWHFVRDDLDPYWGDINDHLSQICDMLDQDSEVIGGLSDTVDTLASHRIDEVVRVLTVVTVLTIPFSLLATLFGMNIVLPGAEQPRLFYGIIASGGVLAGLQVLFLRRRRWI